MGTLPSQPDRELDVMRREGNGLAVGCASMRGWRPTMEDAHACEMDIPALPDWSWIAVFDGHGGSLVAQESAKHLLQAITKFSQWRGDCAPSEVAAAVTAGFLYMDNLLRSSPRVRKDDSGSTACAALVSPTHIFLVNCGDSRCLLIRDAKVLLSSKDHKPTVPAERKRVLAASGTVTMGRVNGLLAVSRALGDFMFKSTPDLPPDEQPVSPVPDVLHVPRSPLDAYIVLACDGVWDVMTDDEVRVSIAEHVARGVTDMGAVSAHIVTKALQLGSRDNISCSVVRLPGAPMPSRAVQERLVRERQLAHATSTAVAEPEGHADLMPSSSVGVGAAMMASSSVNAKAPA